MHRLVLIVPEQVEWTGGISPSFTTAANRDHLHGPMPQVYGYLRRGADGWRTLVIKNADIVFSDEGMDHTTLVKALEIDVDMDVVLLMERGDYEVLLREVTQYIPHAVVIPECRYSTVKSG